MVTQQGRPHTGVNKRGAPPLRPAPTFSAQLGQLGQLGELGVTSAPLEKKLRDPLSWETSQGPSSDCWKSPNTPETKARVLGRGAAEGAPVAGGFGGGGEASDGGSLQPQTGRGQHSGRDTATQAYLAWLCASPAHSTAAGGQSGSVGTEMPAASQALLALAPQTTCPSATPGAQGG